LTILSKEIPFPANIRKAGTHDVLFAPKKSSKK
jgi:hypothetical protein